MVTLFFPYRDSTGGFFHPSLNFWSGLGRSSLELSNEFGSECGWIDTCYCQYMFGEEEERGKEK